MFSACSPISQKKCKTAVCKTKQIGDILCITTVCKNKGHRRLCTGQQTKKKEQCPTLRKSIKDTGCVNCDFVIPSAQTNLCFFVGSCYRTVVCMCWTSNKSIVPWADRPVGMRCLPCLPRGVPVCQHAPPCGLYAKG